MLRRPRDEAHDHLIAYDIGDDRRRRQVVRELLRVGRRIQFSVFEVRLTEAALAAVLVRLARLIHRREDRIDVVSLCTGCQGRRRRLGAAEPAGRDWYVG